MAYGETFYPNRRAGTLAAVGAIHVALGYALVIGLAGHGFAIKDRHIIGIPVPRETPTPPPPDPTPTASIAPRDPFDPIPAPSPSMSIAPFDPAFIAGPASPLSSDGGIGDVEFPTRSPTPLPSFSPVGPRPLGNAGLWVTPDDYPANDLRQEHTGITKVLLAVGVAGRVENCAVTGSSGYAALDAAACAKIVQRARFKPGTDSTGAIAGGRYATSVKWEIPK